MSVTTINACTSTASNTTLNDVSIEDLSSNSSETQSESAIRLGILLIDSATSVHERYTPLADYLTETIGRPVELVALNQDSQFIEVENENLDFISNNPLAAVQIQRLYDTEFLTTLERPKTGTQFGGLIIAHNDSKIQTLSDLKGKTAACVDFETAAAGCLFQIYHLLENDIDPFQDFASFIENPSQDSIVLAVLNGTIDVGFIRTGQLEKMTLSGLIQNTDELKVINPKNNDFFFTHTTALYPEWPIAALSSTDPDLVEQFTNALLRIPDSHPALGTANLTGFLPPEDYESIHNLIESLQLRSWDAQ
ncbi:phosphate/phosphite/phosphonate ABC transporter substrate-binding protein [Oscillatoria sp. CS-180]|uniref:phosphate/phosphite/phosphonate ABC transporter substrate-binding protein n=1 Tax=Oscillatoria sp. CS-180 TaxID=3021720 RepID=UPI00232EE5C8|nr:phosphate/phosphite/phosphonate ABC transporter substrate-binding protein [Oscillatoria sp. CS-180]MDB9529316.1 phosphate/phosphite/phosphonate ABC transporter substrate-binding protein [Oscillatoria sp. CS-180]